MFCTLHLLLNLVTRVLPLCAYSHPKNGRILPAAAATLAALDTAVVITLLVEVNEVPPVEVAFACVVAAPPDEPDDAVPLEFTPPPPDVPVMLPELLGLVQLVSVKKT